MHISKIKKKLGYFALSMVVTLAIASCSLITPPSQPSRLAQASVTIHPDLLANQGLDLVAQPGPWRDVRHLISYGDRLWFCNSVAGINHNSADIYSYDPATQTTRYEHHLFSQDAGTPMVADGLLYWPFEDPRFSADLGEYIVTNGQEWQWRLLPDGKAFHVHTMVAHQGDLFAGTGAWAGGLQRSQDGGQTWQAIYTHPTPPRQVSRLTTLASQNDRLYVGITALHSNRPKLLHWANQTLTSVQDWPPGKFVEDLTPYDDWLYAINRNPDGSSSLWRTRDQTSARVNGLEGYRVRALAASDTQLWAITANESGRFLWQSTNGTDWAIAYEFTDVFPLDIAIHQGQVYVGGRNAQNHGVVLGSTLPPTQPTEQELTFARQRPDAVAMPPGPQPPSARDLEAAIAQLEPRLQSASTYSGPDTQETLAQTLSPLALSHTPQVGAILSQQLQSSLPTGKASLFENKVEEPATDVAHWYMLWAMGLNGQGGKVPVHFLSEPWTTPDNDREKYWQVPPAAIWTVAQLNQADSKTIAALIQRLSNPTDPPWLTGDVVGALSQLTNQRLGYDQAAWQRWWKAAEKAKGLETVHHFSFLKKSSIQG